MKNKQWNFIDKSDWGIGAWQDEPDKMQWLDVETGLPCLIVRGPHGALCGYVGVAEGHPAYQVEYDNLDVDVHGGLTFASRCSGDPNGHSICHIPEKDEPDSVWWLGFDAAHALDLSPSYAHKYGIRPDETYRDLDYIKAECASLARQLSEQKL